MLQNFLLTNLFLVANSLVTVAFILFTFLYLDLYFKTKKRYALYVGLGGAFLALAFAGNLFFEVVEIGFYREYVVLVLQFLGLLSIAAGYSYEIVPTLPGEKGSRKKKLASVVALPLFSSFLYFVNFLLVAFITSKNVHKVHYGKSKEFKPLLNFWWVMTFVFFLSFVTFLSKDRFPVLELAFSRYSLFWIATQVLLLSAFVLMYKWIRLFLSFRNFTKVLFDIWSFSIVLCILITSLFLTINIASYEKEVTNVLKSNGRMVDFSIKRIEGSMADVVETVVSSPDVLSSFKLKESSALQDQLHIISSQSTTLDQLMLIDPDGEIVYSSEDLSAVGSIVGDNPLVNLVITSKESKNEYFVQKEGTISQRLVYQIVLPVFDDREFLGVAVGKKNLGYDFLSGLNSSTGQEVLLLGSDNSVLSYVFNESEGFDSIVYHDTLQFDTVRELDDDGSVFMVINNQPYLGSITNVEDRNDNTVANLVVLNSYDIVASTAQSSMYLTSFYALVLSLLAFIPSYILARKIDRESV